MIQRRLTDLKQRVERLSPFSIIAAAVIVRILFAFAWALFVNVPPENVPLSGETYFQAGADGYIQIARTLLTSGEYAFTPGGFAAHNRPPVQPILLLIFGAWSAQYWYLFWFIGSGLISLLYLFCLKKLADDLSYNAFQRNVLLLVVGFHPYLIFISKTTTFIPAAIGLLTITVFFFLRISRSPKRYAALTGLMSGIVALTHGVFILLPAVFSGLLFFHRKLAMRSRVMASVIIILLASAIVTPWTIRNYRTFGMFIPVVTGNGFNYWKGSGVYFGTKNFSADIIRDVAGEKLEIIYYGAKDPRHDRILWQEALKDMKKRPFRLLPRMLIGVYTFFTPLCGSKWKPYVTGVLNFPVLALIALFFVRNMKEKTLRYRHFVALGVFAYIVLAYSFFLSWGVYFLIVVPLMLFLVVDLWRTQPLMKKQ